VCGTCVLTWEAGLGAALTREARPQRGARAALENATCSVLAVGPANIGAVRPRGARAAGGGHGPNGRLRACVV
jgi:hypothetical protein